MSKKEMEGWNRMFKQAIQKLQSSLRNNNMPQKYAQIFVGANDARKQKHQAIFNNFIDELSSVPQRAKKK